MDPRAFHNLIVIGTIDSLSEDGLSARVQIGDVLTAFRPLPAFYGQNFTANLPARENAQVILNCPSGNVDASIIIGFLWTQDIQPITTERHIDGFDFEDGTCVKYNSETKDVTVNTAGTVIIECAGAVTLTSDADIVLTAGGTLKLKASAIEIDGPVTQSGGDMTSGGISAQSHKHTETGSITQVPM